MYWIQKIIRKSSWMNVKGNKNGKRNGAGYEMEEGNFWSSLFFFSQVGLVREESRRM